MFRYYVGEIAITVVDLIETYLITLVEINLGTGIEKLIKVSIMIFLIHC